jgi:lipopolysaccharide transport system permease protein
MLDKPKVSPPEIATPADAVLTIIEPRSGWQLIDWRELWHYRDLYYFLVLRGIKARYAQSVIGVGWAVIQPLFSMVVFTIVFGKLAEIKSDGIPYALFSFSGLVPWTYFANAITEGSSSLVTNSAMLSKVYFPRLILPLAAVASKLVDFSIAMSLLAVLMLCYGFVPGVEVLLLPLLVLLMMLTAAGLGAWLTALAVQYRDVQHAMGFVVQLMMYAAPVVYPASLVPSAYTIFDLTINPRYLYAINPMVGVIEGFRAALLNSGPIPWRLVGISAVSSLFIAMSGLVYFRRREHLFADVA